MKRIFNRNEAIEYVGGRPNLELLERSGLIKAIPGKAKACDFDLKDLDRAIDTVKLAGWRAVQAEVK
jgi:hypothetical protein